MSLYTITTEYRQLIEAIESGDIPEEAINDTFEAVSLEWDERAEAVLSAIKNLMAEAKNIEDEVKALEERKKAKLRTIDRLKEYISSSMQALNKPTYESARHLVKFTKSSSIRITDEEAFIKYVKRRYPNALRIKKEVSPDKTVIKELLKTVNLPHVAVEVKQNIQIK